MKSVTPKIMIAIAVGTLFFSSAASAGSGQDGRVVGETNPTPSPTPFPPPVPPTTSGSANHFPTNPPDRNDPDHAPSATNVDPRDPAWNTPYAQWLRQNFAYHGFSVPLKANGDFPATPNEVRGPPHAIRPGGGELEGVLIQPPPQNFSGPAEMNAYLRQHGYFDTLGRFHPGSSVPNQEGGYTDNKGVFHPGPNFRPYQGRDQATGDNDSDDEDVGDDSEHRHENAGVNNEHHSAAGGNYERHEDAGDDDSDEDAGGNNERHEDSGDNERDEGSSGNESNEGSSDSEPE